VLFGLIPSRRSVPERGLIADRIEVRIVLCVRAEPLRHVDRAPEVVDRVTRPAGEALAAGDVVEQVGVLRMSLDQYATAVSRLGVLARLVERSGAQSSQPWGSYAFPGVPPSAMIVVSGSSANAVRFTSGRAKTRVLAGATTRSPSSSKTARPCSTR
jgi:hypothetical protein